ncbi:MAG: hypothetical protein DME93_07640, partial [Verrucomicrobia bacterium]
KSMCWIRYPFYVARIPITKANLREGMGRLNRNQLRFTDFLVLVSAVACAVLQRINSTRPKNPLRTAGATAMCL